MRTVRLVALLLAACRPLPTQSTLSDHVPEYDPWNISRSARWADLGRECTEDAPAPSLDPALRNAMPLPTYHDTNVEWAEIARNVPGGWGGGFFLDRGALSVYLKEPSLRSEFIAAISSHITLPRGLDVHDVRVLKGRWDFAQMFDWYRYLNQLVLRESSLTTADVQEARNRIEYGVVDEGGRVRIEQILREAGIPCWLVSIEIEPRAIPAGA